MINSLVLRSKKDGATEMKLALQIAGLTLTGMAALTSANAADMHPSSGDAKLNDHSHGLNTWSGFYLGVNGGHAWSDHKDKYSHTEWEECVENCDGGGYGNEPVFITHPACSGIDSEGHFAGGQAGYNGQFGPLVFGIEGDIQKANIKGAGADDTDTFSTRLDWFGTLRGRAGYDIGHALLYMTGGIAFGDLESRISEWGKFDDTVTGYTIGGGIEYKLNTHLSIKGEYQYITFGNNDIANVSDSYVPSTTHKTTNDAFHTVRVGLNYHITPSYEPLK